MDDNTGSIGIEPEHTVHDGDTIMGDDSDHTPTRVMLHRIRVMIDEIHTTLDVIQGRNLDGCYDTPETSTLAVQDRINEAMNRLESFRGTISQFTDDMIDVLNEKGI